VRTHVKPLRAEAPRGLVPLKALPGFLKRVSEIEPPRQILGGVRAIPYFGAAGDAGVNGGRSGRERG
jgi:hypothetical protein